MEEEDDFDLEDELERELEAGMDVDEGTLSQLFLVSITTFLSSACQSQSILRSINYQTGDTLRESRRAWFLSILRVGACKARSCACTEEDKAPSTLPPAQLPAEVPSGQAPSGQVAMDSSAAEGPERDDSLQENAEMKEALQLEAKRQERQRKNRCVHQLFPETLSSSPVFYQCILLACTVW